MDYSQNGFNFNKQPLEWLNDNILKTLNLDNKNFKFNGTNPFNFYSQTNLYALYETIGVTVESIEIKRYTGVISGFEFYKNTDFKKLCLTSKFYVNNNDSITREQSLLTVDFKGQAVTLCGDRVPSLTNEAEKKFQHNKYYEQSLFHSIYDSNTVTQYNYLSMIYFKIITI